MSQPVLFARIGWMENYAGPTPGDEKPVGGGKYVKENLGHEAFNFKAIDGVLYGYFQPQMASGTIRLERIVPGDPARPLVTGALVVFVATEPEIGGQRIIGWYNDATVYREHQKTPSAERKMFDHYLKADKQKSVLLPTRRRACPVPTGKGAFGRTNLWYRLEADGTARNPKWLTEALEFIADYDPASGNLLTDPTVEAVAEVGDVLESTLSTAAGYESNPTIRKAIEEYAMRAAKAYFESQGYDVQDKSKTKPYDFLCLKDSSLLYVEVKGTRGNGEQVQVTPNEVEHARANAGNSVLFVMHSVTVSNKRIPKVSGGTKSVYNPWHIREESLRPAGYIFSTVKAIAVGK